MLYYILLGLEVFVSIALVGVILLQRSEGGALGIGGGGSGFMTARGAGNLLTRTTGVLATMFFVLAISLTILGNVQRGQNLLVNRLGGKLTASPVATRPAPAATSPAPTTNAPATNAPAGGVVPEAPGGAANSALTGFSNAAPAPTTAAPRPASAPANTK